MVPITAPLSGSQKRTERASLQVTRVSPFWLNASAVIGTGRRALSMNRPDIAGKTGTTNDSKDAWFSGYNGDYMTTVWTGFDQPDTLGRHEFGGTVALPIWMDYMSAALKDKHRKVIAELLRETKA